MSRRNSKRPTAPQLTDELTLFLEALLTMEYLPGRIFNAVLLTLGKKPREYQRETTRSKAAFLWLNIERERARMRSVGEQPYAGGEDVALKRIAHQKGMSVASAKKMLSRYKPKPRMREFAELVIPVLIDGSLWRAVEEANKDRKPGDFSVLENRFPQFKRIQAVMKLAGELAAAAGLPTPSDDGPLSWIHNGPPTDLGRYGPPDPRPLY